MDVLSAIKKIMPVHDVLLTQQEQTYASLDRATNVEASWPLAVVRVNSRTELIDVARACLQHHTPIVMRGAGTGKSGGAVADRHSVIIDVSRLNRILLIDENNLLAEVEPGVILADLQDAVDKRGLFYPPDPASRLLCTIGGTVAENAAGPSTLKYGTTRDYLLGGEALLGCGELMDFGKRCPKGVAGYDIAALLCGSEGSLAIFTKFILRLLPKPKSQTCAMAFFADERTCLRAVNSIFRDGHIPKTLEYIDAHCLKALAACVDFNVPKGATSALIIECDASFVGGADLELDAIMDTLLPHGLIHVDKIKDDVSRQALWLRRSALSDACTRYRGHKISEDVAVPLGAIGELGDAIKQFSYEPQLCVGIFGHAGDGNLHVQIMFNDEQLLPRAQKIRHEILLRVLALGGTITAEHGVGLQKKAYLPLEQSATLIDVQRRIKSAFDPHYLLNPGKIFDR